MQLVNAQACWLAELDPNLLILCDMNIYLSMYKAITQTEKHIKERPPSGDRSRLLRYDNSRAIQLCCTRHTGFISDWLL